MERNRLEKKAADLGLKNVRFLARQPMSSMGAVLELADVLLVHLKEHPLFRITIPSKFQAYMAAGKPVLMGVRGDAAQLLTQAGGGLVCEPENPRSIADAVARFASMPLKERRNMGEAGKRFYDEHLSLKTGVDRFEALFARICGVTASESKQPNRNPECVLQMYSQWGKHLFDLILCLGILPVATPVCAIIALSILVFMGRPILFRQLRAGKGGTPFYAYKFRSMLDLYDSFGRLLPDNLRVTRLGQFLRSSSLDELPAILNVLRGDMSFIGPRPLPVRYDALYDAVQARRLEVRPGMAGYAALFGRNAQSWENIFERDVWYVDHISFLLDLKIMLGIVRVVLSQEGIDRGDHNRNSKFQQRIEALSAESYVSRT